MFPAGRAGRWIACSTPSSMRTVPRRSSAISSSKIPAVCSVKAARNSGLDTIWRSAPRNSSLRTIRSVSSIVRGLPRAPATSRSSSPLAASSPTIRSSTRCSTTERASSSGSGPASARSVSRVSSGITWSSAAASSGAREARAAARAGKKASRPAAPRRDRRPSPAMSGRCGHAGAGTESLEQMVAHAQ